MVVKISVAHPKKEALVLFSREIAQAATGMAPGLTGIVGGRPTVWPKIRLYSCLVPKDQLKVSIEINGETSPVSIRTEGAPLSDLPAAPSSEHAPATDTRVRLIDLAWARSGDKGDHSNIGWSIVWAAVVSPA